MAFVIDMYARRIVGLARQQTMHGCKRCMAGSLNAIAAWLSFRSRLAIRQAEAGIEPSVGSKGDSYDNALAKTINGLYKAEVIHRRSWPTRGSVGLATLEWVAWFNHHRLLGPIGCIPPAEAEANHHRHLASQTSMAQA